MTRYLIILFIANIGLLQAQYTAIPDPYFEQNLISQGIDTEGILDGQVLTADIEVVTYLAYLSPYVQDLTGIEGFAALEVLHCEYILQLYSLDLSQNTNLEELYCDNSPLNSLNISGCINLRVLDCGPCALSDIDVSNNVLLEYLLCNSNTLSFLDVSNNVNLQYLSCSANQLTEIDVSANVELIGLSFRYNEITSINISQNIDLLYLRCADNSIVNIDVSQNENLLAIHAQNNNLVSLNLDQNPVLEVLNCSNNDLEALYVQNGANHLLTGTYVENTQTYNRFRATGNPDLTCIFVDDAAYCTENWLETDTASTFVETQAECDALGVSSFEESVAIQVFPNPVKDVFRIKTKAFIKKVILYNSLGILVKTFNSEEIYKVTDIQKGIYLVRIDIENGFISRKIVVE